MNKHLRHLLSTRNSLIVNTISTGYLGKPRTVWPTGKRDDGSCSCGRPYGATTVTLFPVHGRWMLLANGVLRDTWPERQFAEHLSFSKKKKKSKNRYDLATEFRIIFFCAAGGRVRATTFARSEFVRYYFSFTLFICTFVNIRAYTRSDRTHPIE